MEEDKAQLLVTIMGSCGGGAAILAFIQGMFKWLSGAASRERERNASIARQRLDAIEERERAEDKLESETTKRYQAEEHVAILKAQLREHNLVPRERPTQ